MLTDRKINNHAPQQPFPRYSNVSYMLSAMQLQKDALPETACDAYTPPVIKSWRHQPSVIHRLLDGVGRCGEYPPHAQTTMYRVDVARLIADDAGKMDATLTPGCRCFGFRYSLSRHCNARMRLPLPSCYAGLVVSYMSFVNQWMRPKRPGSYYTVLLLISITLDSLRLSWSL